MAHGISTCWVVVGNPARLPYLLAYKYITPAGGDLQYLESLNLGFTNPIFIKEFFV